MKYQFIYIILINLFIQFIKSAPGDAYSCAGGQQLKIDVVYDYIPSMEANLKQHIQQVMEVSKKFFYDLICIEDETVPTYSGSDDHGFSYTSTDEYDMVIFVVSENNQSASYVANASALGQRSASYRPFYGQVNINEAHYKWTPIQEGDDENTKLQVLHNFEYNLETVLHEIFHVLGLSSSSFPNIKQSYNKDSDAGDADNTGNVLYEEVTAPGTGTYFKIKTDYVMYYAQDYFGSDVEYVPFENEGGSGSQGAHWERLTIRNEFMTASTISSDAAISNLSLAFLKDLNWYKDINIDFLGEDCDYWGRGKGKAFIDAIDTAGDSCSGSPNFREFSSTQQQDQCDFYHFGYGPSGVTSFTNGCYVQQMYGNTDCTNPLNQGDNAGSNFEKYGPQSKCFNSDFGSGSFDYRCYQYYCLSPDADNINVRLVIQYLNSDGNEEGSAICESNVDDGNNITDTPPGIQGTYLQCPENIHDFCNYPVPCENYCSQNGYCIRKQQQNEEIISSICHCIDGFGGKDCSVECANGLVYSELNQSQQVYEYVCKQSVTEQAGNCADGHTLIEEYNFCKMNDCDVSCYNQNQICSGSVTTCVACPTGLYFHNNGCVKKCPYMFIPGVDENNNNICVECSGPDPSHCLQGAVVSKNANNIVQISYDDKVKNVCSTGFSANEAQLICEELNFNTFKSFKIDSECNNDKGFWISSLSCSESGITGIDDCSKNFDPNCDNTQCVEIECQNVENLQELTSQYYSGQILIYKDGVWGGICASSASMGVEEYDAVCKSMGKAKFDYDYNIKYGQCPEVVHYSNIECTEGQELSQCTLTDQNPEIPCNQDSCADFKCTDSTSDQVIDGIGDAADQAKEQISQFLTGLDAIYIILGSLFGTALVSIILICCIARKCMPQGDYVIKLGQKEDMDAGEDYYKG